MSSYIPPHKPGDVTNSGTRKWKRERRTTLWSESARELRRSLFHRAIIEDDDDDVDDDDDNV
ncbi:hypothetical protein E2C01_094339 [Portunus trituberculatus]|uniref:Uncharacterized protein n=1 Tax=Portunus trituberculatus TaxID=210409 RepID=A0A5B7JQ61_PORTR|nr:hypothetical protein [Portunus trituberculatus]